MAGFNKIKGPDNTEYDVQPKVIRKLLTANTDAEGDFTLDLDTVSANESVLLSAKAIRNDPNYYTGWFGIIDSGCYGQSINRYSFKAIKDDCTPLSRTAIKYYIFILNYPAEAAS